MSAGPQCLDFARGLSYGAEMLTHPSENDWLMHRGNYQAWDFSRLRQINATIVANLQLRWVWAIGWRPAAKPSTMLQEVHRSQTGQAVYVFALPKQF
jgi:glucose dehydrogenase